MKNSSVSKNKMVRVYSLIFFNSEMNLAYAVTSWTLSIDLKNLTSANF